MIYLDNNATTPIHPRVAVAIEPYLHGHPGNPSSSHALGHEAAAAVVDRRASRSRPFLGAPRARSSSPAAGLRPTISLSKVWRGLTGPAAGTSWCRWWSTPP